MKMTQQTTTPEPFVGTERVAEFLGKPVSYVHNNAAVLGIPRYRLGTHYRYLLSEVAAWLTEQRQQ